MSQYPNGKKIVIDENGKIVSYFLDSIEQNLINTVSNDWPSKKPFCKTMVEAIAGVLNIEVEYVGVFEKEPGRQMSTCFEWIDNRDGQGCYPITELPEDAPVIYLSTQTVVKEVKEIIKAGDPRNWGSSVKVVKVDRSFTLPILKRGVQLTTLQTDMVNLFLKDVASFPEVEHFSKMQIRAALELIRRFGYEPVLEQPAEIEQE